MASIGETPEMFSQSSDNSKLNPSINFSRLMKESSGNS